MVSSMEPSVGAGNEMATAGMPDSARLLLRETIELLRLAAAPAVLLAIVAAMLNVWLVPEPSIAPDGVPSFEWTTVVWQGALFSFAYGCLYFVFLQILLDRSRGRKDSAALRVPLWTMVRLIAVQWAVFIPQFLGFLLLVLPGLVLTSRWILLGPIVVDHRGSAWQALGESWRATAGHTWTLARLLGILLGAAGLTSGLMSVVMPAAAGLQGTVWWTALRFGLALAGVVAAVLQWAATVVVYRHLLPSPGSDQAV